MTYAYEDTRSTQNHFWEPRGMLGRAVDGVAKAADWCADVYSEDYPQWKRERPQRQEVRRKGWWSRMVTVVLLLQLLWIWTLYYSERIVFSNAIAACDWRRWENWASGANPHHVALIADPQLVDPHTYPGRPWPLSTLTIRYTDLYLKRVYKLMQEQLYPDSTIFLGDLFDGGREWKVSSSDTWEPTDKSWKKYGNSFWMREYRRFGDIFFDIFTGSGTTPREGQHGKRRIISTLPGNHDLGFSTGVHIPVRVRFETYFGEGNRVDILGNHTFVSIDGVSLSAKDHAAEGTDAIWKPTMEFLENMKMARTRAVAKDLKRQYGVEYKKRYEHVVFDRALENHALPDIERLNDTNFPAVLLSHVPLYRDSGTPCGPLREHWPPSASVDSSPTEKDDRNAIAVQAGYQYQNVLSHDLTTDITTKIGDVQYAFSGDDHDYCDVTHMRYPSGGGGIREITVKSISWAMGVRKPGFVTLSLWNPIDHEGRPIGGTPEEPTLQSHLCLLPDQLGIFIRYGILFVVTLLVLVVRAAHMSANPTRSVFASPQSPTLPTSNPHNGPSEAEEAQSSSTSSSDDGSLKASYDRSGRRSRATSNPRQASPAKSLGGYGYVNSDGNGYSVPLVHHAGYFAAEDRKDSLFINTRPNKAKRLNGLSLFYAEFKWSFLRVAFIAGPLYFWLIWRG